MPLLDAASVPAGPINTIAEAFALAEQLGLKPVRTLTRAGDGAAVRQPSSPIGLSETPVAYNTPPPLLGEHTQEVLDWLGAASAVTARASDQAPFDNARSA